MEGIITAWGRILAGYKPSLSIEITRECPLRCPGCYAYGDEHLGGGVTLRQVSDYKGDELVENFFKLVDEHKPLHLSIVGGEPLVRFRELNTILPRLAERGIYSQLVTSAVRPIPAEWAATAPPADRRVDRRAAARARRAPDAGHLRPHPEAHRRPPDHRALHRDAAAGPARRLPRGVHPLLVRERERAHDLGQPLHAADRRGVRRTASARRSRARRRRPDAPAAASFPSCRCPKG